MSLQLLLIRGCIDIAKHIDAIGKVGLDEILHSIPAIDLTVAGIEKFDQAWQQINLD